MEAPFVFIRVFGDGSLRTGREARQKNLRLVLGDFTVVRFVGSSQS